MIVHPDFLDHRKTAKLIEQSGDATAPMWLLRLWAYCQVSRRWVFDHLDANELKHVCRASIDADKLLTLLVACRWVTVEGEKLTVRDWEQHNRMLVSAWENGKRGGAPNRTDNRSGQSVTRSDNRSTRAGVREEDKIRAGYPVGSHAKLAAKDNPLGSGPLAGRGNGGIKAGKLQLIEKSHTQPSEKQRQATIKKFGRLAGQLAKQLRSGEKV